MNSTQPEGQHGAIWPSIWCGVFRNHDDYRSAVARLAAAFNVFDVIDDRMLASRHPFSLHAWCSACSDVTAMRFDWVFGVGGADGSIHPAWTETGVCPECHLGSRMRALIDYLHNRLGKTSSRRVYAAEQTTPSFAVLRSMYPGIVGSEFLGPDYRSGAQLRKGWFGTLRHEDLTALSFDDASFDLVITQDVFEHVPDYCAAFREVRRVLAPSGHLVFTIPFSPELETTRVRAEIAADGSVIHLLPPEIHGNPVSSGGSLCFQNFGWDVLDALRSEGFSDAMATMYWGPWQGHLGFPLFVFHARR